MTIIRIIQIHCVGKKRSFNFKADEIIYLLAGDSVVCEAVSRSWALGPIFIPFRRLHVYH